MAVPYARHRFTVDEYHRLAEACVLPSDARVELIDGELVETLVTMKPRHAAAVRVLTRRLTTLLAGRAYVQAQLPVTLGDLSEPEPDVAILRSPERAYATRHPAAADVFALIEVVDASRAFDLQRKVPLYAAFAIPDVWVVDLVESCVHVFREPREGSYARTLRYERGDAVAPLAFSSAAIDVAEIV